MILKYQIHIKLHKYRFLALSLKFDQKFISVKLFGDIVNSLSYKIKSRVYLIIQSAVLDLEFITFGYIISKNFSIFLIKWINSCRYKLSTWNLNSNHKRIKNFLSRYNKEKKTKKTRIFIFFFCSRSYKYLSMIDEIWRTVPFLVHIYNIRIIRKYYIYYSMLGF